MRLLLIATLAGCLGSCRLGFEFGQAPGVDDGGALPNVPGELPDALVPSPDGGPDAPVDAQIGAQADAGPFVCSTAGILCPGGQPLLTLSCGAPTDCWVGCTDGDVVSPAQAAAFCTSWGGRLANIDSDAEESCVRSVLDGAIIHGLVQETGQTDLDGGWSWNGDGVTPVYTRWDNGQPNDEDGGETGVEQCAYSNSATFWHDTACDLPTSARFSCRYP